MKIFKKVMVVSLLAAVLALAACGGRPQPVTKAQHDAARQEALDAEARMTALQREKNELESELNAKNALLEALKEMEREGL